MQVKQVNFCLDPKILKVFDEKIHPIHRSTALAILIKSFLETKQGISDYGHPGQKMTKKENNR